MKNVWTANEDALLRQYFATHSPAVIESLGVLPGRTWSAIKTRCSSLNLYRNGRQAKIIAPGRKAPPTPRAKTSKQPGPGQTFVCRRGTATKGMPVENDDAAIAAYLAAHGTVRKIDPAASGDPLAVRNWLRIAHGISVETPWPGQYRIRGRVYTYDEFISYTDKLRIRDGLEPLVARDDAWRKRHVRVAV